MTKTGQAAKAYIESLKADYRVAYLAHMAKPSVTLAEGTALNQRKAAVYVAMEEFKLFGRISN